MDDNLSTTLSKGMDYIQSLHAQTADLVEAAMKEQDDSVVIEDKRVMLTSDGPNSYTAWFISEEQVYAGWGKTADKAVARLQKQL